MKADDRRADRAARSSTSKQRGLLDRTLVVLASEFGRDMMIEGKSGKEVKDQAIDMPDVMTDIAPLRHAPPLHRGRLGADVRRRDEEGLRLRQNRRRAALHDHRATRSRIEDLHATIFHALGIPPDTAYVVEKRPFYVTRDGVGKPHLDLFA